MQKNNTTLQPSFNYPIHCIQSATFQQFFFFTNWAFPLLHLISPFLYY
ncbi:hypothetical protein D840_00892 [Enterococcus faecalis 20.SD.W.06]|nr:hypothetical protein D840_00892 [Enterococcus faecalis 20.SD.W.06]